MLFAKYKYSLTVSGGTVALNTNSMRGMIEQIIITPTTSTNQWDLNLIDRDGDIIYNRVSEVGTVNDRTALVPAGRDSSEILTISFLNVTINEVIKIIFKVREQY